MQLKKLFFILALLGSMLLPAHAQFSGGTAYRIISGSSLPATCTAGPGVADVYVKTGGSPGIYYCSATNTWTLAAGGGGGTGDVVGPASATDNAVVRFDLTTGKLVQNSVVLIGDTGNITGVGTLNTHTIPGGTDTFALLNATQTLASKTLSSPLVSGTLIQTSNAAQAFCSGPNGCTNPVLSTVNNVASAATGVAVTGNAAGAGAVVAITSPNATENLTIQAKGSGAAVILGTTAGAQVVHFGSTAGSSIYSTTASGGDINFRSANSTFTFQGASGATFPSSSGWIELNGAARLFGPSAGVLRLGANGSTTAAGKLLVAPSTVTALGDITIGNATNPELSFSDTADTGGIRFNSTSNVLEWSNDRSTWNTFSGGGGSGANPTASVGLSTVNGVATTFMRSDAAPPLSQSITPTWTGAHLWNAVTGTFRRNSIGTTSTTSLVLENTTAAAAGAQQYSPAIELLGNGWKTAATAGSQPAGIRLEARPIQGSTAPNAGFVITQNVNGTYSDIATFTYASVNPVLDFAVTAKIRVSGTDAIIMRPGNQLIGMTDNQAFVWGSDVGNTNYNLSLRRFAAGVLRVGDNTTTGAGSVLVGTSSGAIGTSGAGVIAAALSTAPANATDTSQAYSTDFNAVAGDARWHFLSETGNPIGLGNNSIGMQNPIAANGASQAGRAFTVFGSAATASLDTAGAAAGGNVNINTGAAARLTSGNANGGDFNVVLGAGIGTGTSGVAAFSESGASRGTRFRGQGAYSGRVAVEWYESGGSIRNSIVGAMGSGNDLIFFGSSGSTEYGRYDSLGNWMVGTSSSPASLAKGLVIGNGTAATAGAADKIGLWSADATAGDANLYSINEAGQINRLTGLAVRNSAQFDVTSSTALASITGLTENVEAGRTYAFRAYVQTSAGAGGIKLAVGGTATATAISYEGELTSASDDNVVLIDRATALGTVVCDSTTTTSGTCKIEGVIQVNAAGTLVIQFAQSASNGTASSVLANQYLQLIPIS